MRKKSFSKKWHFEAFPAGKDVKNLLSTVLKKIDNRQKNNIGRISEIWNLLLGERYAPMTKVVEFHEGVLTIKIDSAPLFSILKSEQKTQLEKEMRKRMPTLQLKKLNFQR